MWVARKGETVDEIAGKFRFLEAEQVGGFSCEKIVKAFFENCA
jgi:hypothetical protein